jgi:hypothetical protein
MLDLRWSAAFCIVLLGGKSKEQLILILFTKLFIDMQGC